AGWNARLAFDRSGSSRTVAPVATSTTAARWARSDGPDKVVRAISRLSVENTPARNERSFAAASVSAAGPAPTRNSEPGPTTQRPSGEKPVRPDPARSRPVATDQLGERLLVAGAGEPAEQLPVVRVVRGEGPDRPVQGGVSAGHGRASSVARDSPG